MSEDDVERGVEYGKEMMQDQVDQLSAHVASLETEIVRLRAALKLAYEHGNNCYARVLNLPSCDVDFCQCGKSK